MKYIILVCAIFLTGCSTTSKRSEALQNQEYYDTLKAVSRDMTVSQTACWAAVTEIAKSSDNTVKAMAIALAEKCKADSSKLLPNNPRISISN
jgi:hypothetical protein